jgi:hypothetical protein
MKLTILAFGFFCLLVGSLLSLSTAGHRLSSPLAWLGLGLVGGTVAAAVWVGWPL